jgi:peptide/nickel transport system permease protein
MRFVLRRVAECIATLCATAVVAFTVFHLLPGDPAAVVAGEGASSAQVRAIRATLGLSGGILPQFGHWAVNLFHGDLGRSVISNVPVSTLLAQRLPVTLQLIAVSVVVALVVAIPLSLAALRPHSFLDRLVVLWSIVMLSIPVFWLAELFILLFSLKLHWLPASGWVSFFSNPLEALRSSLLGALSFGFYLSSFLIQFLRSALMNVMNEDFILTARAKGLSERSILIHHALRPTMVPFLTVLGIVVGTSVGATIVIEEVFNYPGFGQLFIQAIAESDYYVVQAGILLIVGSVVIMNTLVDVCYGFLDPQMRLGK